MPSHHGRPCQVDAHDPVVSGRDSTAMAFLTIGGGRSHGERRITPVLREPYTGTDNAGRSVRNDNVAAVRLRDAGPATAVPERAHDPALRLYLENLVTPVCWKFKRRVADCLRPGREGTGLPPGPFGCFGPPRPGGPGWLWQRGTAGYAG